MKKKKKARKIIQFVLHGHDNSERSNKQNEIKRQKNDVDNEPVKEGKNGEKARTNLDERAWNQKQKLSPTTVTAKTKTQKSK